MVYQGQGCVKRNGSIKRLYLRILIFFCRVKFWDNEVRDNRNFIRQGGNIKLEDFCLLWFIEFLERNILEGYRGKSWFDVFGGESIGGKIYIG